MARLLLIDDDVDFSPLLVQQLSEWGHQVRWLETAEEGLILFDVCKPSLFDLILLDNCMPRLSGLEFLEELRRRNIDLPVVLLTGNGTSEVAIRAARWGALRYLPKPDDLEQSLTPLLQLIAQIAHLPHRMPEEIRSVRTEEETLLGKSESMHSVYEQIGLAAAHEEPVLITGETGTGKKLAAHAIHRHGSRGGRPLLRLNCLAWDANRLEDELFGYEDGVCSETEHGKPGIFEQANGGTVLLDHFHVLPLSVQTRIVHIIEDGFVERGGRGTVARRVDVRLMAIGSQNLTTAVAAGTLDPALYFLLTRSLIHMPPLRERGNDVQLLADHFLRNMTLLRRPARGFAAATRERLRRHPWPGNVRELQGVVRQAALNCRGAEINPHELRLDVESSQLPDHSNAGECPLPPSRLKAYQLFRWALEQNPELVECSDAEVFRWLRQDPRVEGDGLPDRCDTFRRYLREARAHYQDHKHTPRANRPTGRSVVRIREI